MTSQVAKDLAVAEAIAVPLILILLVIAFGSVVAALLPLVIGLIAIVGTFAELYVLGSLTDVSVFAINLTTALGLGLGIDYALLMISRFREQLAEGADVPDAVRHTVRTAGRTITFSAATVAVALSALLVFPQYFLRSFAYAGIGVVVIAAVSALLVVPALLAVLGHRVNNGRLPWAKTVRSAEAPFWGRLARTVMRRPALTALPVLAVLLLAASPLLGVTFGTPDERVLPETAAEPPGRDRACRTTSPATTSRAVQIVIDRARGPGRAERVRDRTVRGSTARSAWRPPPAPSPTAGPPRPARRPPPSAGPTPSGSPSSATSPPSRTRRRPWSRTYGRSLRPPGPRPWSAAPTRVLVDSKDSIADRLPLAIGLVAVTTFILLFLFTGSVVQPLRALVLNVHQPDGGHRRHGVDLPGRPSLLPARLHAAADGHVDDRADVLHRLRSVHGLRGLRDQPDQGTARRGRRHGDRRDQRALGTPDAS